MLNQWRASSALVPCSTVPACGQGRPPGTSGTAGTTISTFARKRRRVKLGWRSRDHTRTPCAESSVSRTNRFTDSRERVNTRSAYCRPRLELHGGVACAAKFECARAFDDTPFQRIIRLISPLQASATRAYSSGVWMRACADSTRCISRVM